MGHVLCRIHRQASASSASKSGQGFGTVGGEPPAASMRFRNPCRPCLRRHATRPYLRNGSVVDQMVPSHDWAGFSTTGPRRVPTAGKSSAAKVGSLHVLRPPHNLSGNHRPPEVATWYQHHNRNSAPIRCPFTSIDPASSSAITTCQPSRFQAQSLSRGPVGSAKVLLGEGDSTNVETDQCETTVECC